MRNLSPVHFTDNYLLNPPNPISVNLIGVGGTGSQVIGGLSRINHALKALGHPGLHVRAFDGDKITEANLGRQAFAKAELGLNKAVALIHRINRFFGIGWKSVPHYFSDDLPEQFQKYSPANIYITCVDEVAARFEIAKKIIANVKSKTYDRDAPLYWLDCGNSNNTGQVILATAKKITQPKSGKFRPVSEMPFITVEFDDLLREQALEENKTPSCSLAEALEYQDLFINPFVAIICCKLFWGLFRTGMTENRGVFVNLDEFTMTPLKVA